MGTDASRLGSSQEAPVEEGQQVHDPFRHLDEDEIDYPAIVGASVRIRIGARDPHVGGGCDLYG
jgi:hypothetical protein